MPASSAPPELSAMVFCVADQCFNVCCPHTHTPPLVDRRAVRHPATSVSTYARLASPASCQGK
eukprot:6862908-Alexandrium_andersonii.AAC.1